MTSTRRTTGILMIALPLVFMVGFTGLQMTFEYPDILRHPGGEVLARFAAGGADLHLYWYLMMISALSFVPLSIGAGLAFWKKDNFIAALSMGFGVLAGLVQALGLIRWVMLVPQLAANYVAPGASALDQAMAVSLFDAANAYLGMGVGEHLGYFFTGLWTIMLAVLVWGNWRYLAIAGLVLAAGVMAGMLEPFGVPLAGIVNAISFTGWALWTLVLGVMLVRKPAVAGAAAVVQPA